MVRERSREARLRRMAQRQGLRLVKSRRRDPYALDYRAYWLVDEESGEVVFRTEVGGGVSTLDNLEAYLTRKG